MVASSLVERGKIDIRDSSAHGVFLGRTGTKMQKTWGGTTNVQDQERSLESWYRCCWHIAFPCAHSVDSAVSS